MRIRKIKIICLLALTLLLCTACGNKDKNTADNNSQDSNVSGSNSSCYDKGQEMVLTMHELACDENYINLSVRPTEKMQEIIDKISSMDYSSPAHVYRISNLDDILPFVMMSGGISTDNVSDNVIGVREERTVCGLGTMITANTTGTDGVTVQSLFIADTCFVNTGVKDYEVYIYTYSDAYPVIVSFIPGANGAVRATSRYLLDDDIIGEDALSNYDRFSMLNIKLEEINN